MKNGTKQLQVGNDRNLTIRPCRIHPRNSLVLSTITLNLTKSHYKKINAHPQAFPLQNGRAFAIIRGIRVKTPPGPPFLLLAADSAFPVPRSVLTNSLKIVTDNSPQYGKNTQKLEQGTLGNRQTAVNLKNSTL
jgi:hypothetical protein